VPIAKQNRKQLKLGTGGQTMCLSVEMVMWMSEIEKTDPQLYGGVIGCCIGFIAMFIIYIIWMLIEAHTQKKEKKMLNATDLLGEDVVYDRDSFKVEGQVVSIDFDLEESGLVTTIYLDVDWMDEYFKIDYGKDFKRIHLKGADNEQREAD
jgi:hypothetical protein